MAPVRKRKATTASQEGISAQPAAGGAKRKKARKAGPVSPQAPTLEEPSADPEATETLAGPQVNSGLQEEEAMPAAATQPTPSSSSSSSSAPAPNATSAAGDGEPAPPSGGADGEAAAVEAAKGKKTKAKKKASKQDGAEDGEKEDRRGIIHMASVPTYMNHLKLRHLLSQYGEVERIYLKPEEAHEAKKRKRMGGCSKPIFVEGWVEFAERKVARRVAMSLNGNTVGGKKRNNFWRDTMWNMRYLPKFKWHQLKEGDIYNRQVRKARLTQKLEQARRENSAFLEQVERAKTREHIIAKKGGDKKAEAAAAAAAASGEGKPGADAAKGKGKGKGKGKAKGKGKGKGKKGSFPEVDKSGAISDSLLTSLFS